MVVADARTAITFALSKDNGHYAPEERELLRDLYSMPGGLSMVMDKVYEGDETRQLVLALDIPLVVPPESNRIELWKYDGELQAPR